MTAALRSALLALALLALQATPASARQAPDTDGDGRSDEVEGTGDLDGDGIPNHEDAHDFWVSGEAVDGSAVIWLVGAGEDGTLDTGDDVVVGKLDGPEFRFQNVNAGPYRVVAGPDPATADESLIHRLEVTDAAVENLVVGRDSEPIDQAPEPGAESPDSTTPTPTVPETAVQPTESGQTGDGPTGALALDDSNPTDPFDPILLGLVAASALLFGVLLRFGAERLTAQSRL